MLKTLIGLLTSLGMSLLAQSTTLLDVPKVHETPCVFCKPDILEKQSVFISKHFNVMPSYEPRTPGHLLVVPKRHVAKAHELSSDEWSELSVITTKIVQVFSKFLATDDYIILEKNGVQAFQDVLHVHFHFFPVRSVTWSSIFDVDPKKLSPQDLEDHVLLFQDYFKAVDD